MGIHRFDILYGSYSIGFFRYFRAVTLEEAKQQAVKWFKEMMIGREEDPEYILVDEWGRQITHWDGIINHEN